MFDYNKIYNEYVQSERHMQKKKTAELNLIFLMLNSKMYYKFMLNEKILLLFSFILVLFFTV